MTTQFFAFENLTWPEVAALPRDLPLVIPLGNGYDLELLAEALGNPSRAALLPPIPFGFHGSGLEVPPTVLMSLIDNLLESLCDDGFSRVFALTPQNAALPLGNRAIHLPLPGKSLPPLPLPPDEMKDRVILIPVGHTEQHAYHLPLSTDTLIIEAVSHGTANAIPAGAFSLPVFPYGVSMHRAAFAGTLNCGGRAFEDFWLSVIDALIYRGFQTLYLMSGHGGNMSFLHNIVKYAGDRHPYAFCVTSFLYLSGPEGVAALEKHRQSGLGGMGHACELETSFILHLQPQLVHMERVVDETDFITTPSYYMDWVEGGALVANPPWEDDTATGAYGAGSLGTAEKGRLWLDAAVAEKKSHVDEILEQHRRRCEKRRHHGS